MNSAVKKIIAAVLVIFVTVISPKYSSSNGHNSMCNGYDSSSNFYDNTAPPIVTLMNAAVKKMIAAVLVIFVVVALTLTLTIAAAG
eukprot:8894696-Ditylum_brightwellii.AAC.1